MKDDQSQYSGRQIKESSIEDLVYILKQAKEEKLPQPIFFLGAGASKTGNIPSSDDIVKDILEKYSNNPRIKELSEDKRNYPTLMECLHPFARNKLLKEYIDKAKINVTHIYLAQLMKEGYVDYVLTVNFDNLLLRALALFNEFPATYDMAILKDLTTTKPKEKSIIFLHGQHHGIWLLNTEEEMNKVKKIIPPILHSIKDRTWIFIGYSGEDPIFEHIQDLGSFDKGLYWVAYNDKDPNTKIKEFLTTPNTNAFIIKGFDADSFMLKLNNELGLEQPTILDKPFTIIRSMLNNIVDIDDKEHFKGVKERLEISKNQVDKAIQQFEIGDIEIGDKTNLIKRKIISLLIVGEYPIKEIEEIENESKNLNNNEINGLLSVLYLNWGNNLRDLAQTKKGTEAEELYKQAFEKFHKTIEIKPDDHEAFNNWGIGLRNLAQTKKGTEAEELYKQAFEKFHKGIEFGRGYYNLACTYALQLNKENAFYYLDKSLENNETAIEFVKKDKEWKNYIEDIDFINILEKHKDKIITLKTILKI